jgi:hypothetical protein
MRLLEDFAFVDDNGVRWLAPAGSVIDGASIPDTLWLVAGTPYIGDYRRATVIHDVACQQMARPSKDVHRMFYDAMITDGVPEARAQQMYTAVRLFGPSWVIPEAGFGMEGAPAIVVTRRTLTIDELEAALDAALGE